MTKILTKCLVFLALLQAPLAKAGSISAELSPTDGALGDTFVLTLMLEGGNRSDPVIPNVDGLQFQQQGVSQSMSIVNGQSTSQLQLTVLVLPERPGDFTIPSITAEVDGQKVATVPLKLKVRAAGSQGGGAQAQRGGNANPNSHPNANAGTKGGSGGTAESAGVFIERECDTTSVYVGQQVACTMRLYHRGNLNGGQRVSQSSADFRRFNIDGEKRYQKVVNGQRYGVIELKELVVPTKAGNLDLPPYSIEARVLVWTKQNNPLDKFFDKFGGGVFNFDLNFTEERAVTVASEPQRFHVKPLPDAGKPKNFNGLVGLFNLEASLSKAKIAAGDTVTITIKIEGNGLTDTLGDIGPTLTNIGKVYPDKPEYVEQITAENGIVSRKIYKYAVVPSRAGQYDLGPVEVPAFNPKLNQYVTLKADLGRLIVDPAQVEHQPAPAGPSLPAAVAKEDVKAIGNDLVDLHRGTNLISQQTITNVDKIIFSIVAGSPIASALLALGLFIYRNREQDPLAQRRSHAYRSYRDGMSNVQVDLAAGHVTAALAEAHKVLRTYLGDRLGTQGGSLTAREIESILGKLGADVETRSSLNNVVEGLERLEFGGKAPAPEHATELLATLDKVIVGLEKA